MFGSKKKEAEQEAEQNESALTKAGKSTKKFFKRLIWTVVILAILAAAALLWYYYGTSRTEKCTVTKTEQTYQGQQVYRVYTSPAQGSTDKCGVMTIHDTLAYMNFNSADIFGSMQQGQDYEIKNYGFRNGFFSWFPNITSVTPMGTSTPQTSTTDENGNQVAVTPSAAAPAAQTPAPAAPAAPAATSAAPVPAGQ